MAKNKSYTGNRKAVGTPTLNGNQYKQLMRLIRRTREKRDAEVKKEKDPVSESVDAV